jgi:hypothetical protein
MAANKLFLVTKEDTIIQTRTYLVRAYDENQAERYVDDGMFIEESEPSTIETLNSITGQIEEITSEGIGQERNATRKD